MMTASNVVSTMRYLPGGARRHSRPDQIQRFGDVKGTIKAGIGE